MPINLLNEQDLNNFLTRFVFSTGCVPSFSSENLADASFVDKNREIIALSMVLQWTKHRLRAYLKEKSNLSFFTKVIPQQADLPEWAIENLVAGLDVYQFSKDSVPPSLLEKMNRVCVFLKKMALKYIDKQVAISIQDEIPVKLRLEYLKTGNQYRDFNETYRLAGVWESVEENRKTHRFHRNERSHSQIGTKKIMDLSDGYYIVQILTDEAREFESYYMNHCLGKERCDASFKSGKMRVYSMRDSKGEPHVTFDIRDRKWDENDVFKSFLLPKDSPDYADGIIYQIRGKNDKSPMKRYIPYIQEFVSNYKFGFTLFQANKAGMVYCDGCYYNIFNMPKNLVIEGDLDISDIGLSELPDLSTITVKGNFDCSNNKLKTLKGSPRSIGKTFNCSGNELVSLEGGPNEVGIAFFCGDNLLKTLKGAPSEVKGLFYCAYNQLIGMEGFPKKFGALHAHGNPIFDFAFRLIYGNKIPQELLYDEFQKILPRLQGALAQGKRQLFSMEKEIKR